MHNATVPDYLLGGISKGSLEFCFVSGKEHLPSVDTKELEMRSQPFFSPKRHWTACGFLPFSFSALITVVLKVPQVEAGSDQVTFEENLLRWSG